MAYFGSKGWYIKHLKDAGITKHPEELRKLELYKTYVLRNLYFELVAKKETP
ncbi:YflJ family protein [Bacillus kexueae]|uniref:YflJ family protein n=1 Tax=Aeribacillus kexueae TaxID=2078952 RepID=UPI001FAFBCDC|nr:YflJ family protein [Bacillus kexueae]